MERQAECNNVRSGLAKIGYLLASCTVYNAAKIFNLMFNVSFATGT